MKPGMTMSIAAAVIIEISAVLNFATNMTVIPA